MFDSQDQLPENLVWETEHVVHLKGKRRLPGRLDVLQGRDVSCTGEPPQCGQFKCKAETRWKRQEKKKNLERTERGRWGQERKMLYTNSQRKSWCENLTFLSVESPATQQPLRTDPASQSHLTSLHPVLEVPRYSAVSRASKDHHPLSLSEMASSRDESRTLTEGEECRKRLFYPSLTSLRSLRLL